jgi:hypothetical protein
VTVGSLFGEAARDYDRARRQLVCLREAGFGEVDCRYKDHRFAVYSGKKGYEASDDGKDDDG